MIIIIVINIIIIIIVLIIVKMIVEWSPLFFSKNSYFIVDICNIPFKLKFDFKHKNKSFTLRYIEIRNHFLKYYPPPPRVPAKVFACICVTIFYTLYGSGLLAQRRERCSVAQKPRAEAHKQPFLPNKK